MEWLWRLLRQPSRIIRQIALPQYILTLLVEENEKMRLDKWITKKCEDLSRTRLQKLIEEEKIFVNGKIR